MSLSKRINGVEGFIKKSKRNNIEIFDIPDSDLIVVTKRNDGGIISRKYKNLERRKK